MISMELLAAPVRLLWSWCILHSSSLRNFAASFWLFYHRRIFSSTFLLICNKNPLYHHDFQCLKISVWWSITLLRKPCCRSKPPPGAWLSEGTRFPGPLIKRIRGASFVNFQICAESLYFIYHRYFIIVILCIICIQCNALQRLSSSSGVQKVCKNVQTGKTKPNGQINHRFYGRV